MKTGQTTIQIDKAPKQNASDVASSTAPNTEDSESAPAAKIPKVQPKNAPAQEKLTEELKVLKSQFFNMQSLENSGLSLVSSKDMTGLKRKILEKEKAVKRLASKAKCEGKRRQKLKETITKLSQSSDVAAKSLKPFQRDCPGRPALETDQPGIIEAILDIVLATTATDDRRRTEILRTTRYSNSICVEVKS